MSHPKLKVSRAGKILGDFSREEIIEGISKGTFLPTDHYWDSGNKEAGWQRLEQLPKDSSNREKSRAAETSTKEKTKEDAPGNGPADEWESPMQVIGYCIGYAWLRLRPLAIGLFIILGIYNLFESWFNFNARSAIHQGVLAQWQTNGILFLILALLLRRR